MTRSRLRGHLTTATAVVSAMIVVSCGGGAGSRPGSESEAPGTTAAATVGGTDAVAAFEKAAGVLLIGCDSGVQSGRSFVVLDPQTGAIRAELDPTALAFNGALGQGPLRPASNLCGEPRALSPDRRRLAVASSNFDDDSSHVGWVELATGRQTDVTAASVGKDFAAATPKDTDPRFGRDGRLYFNRAGVIPTMVADQSGTVTQADPVGGCTALATCPPLTHVSGRFFLDDEPPRNGLRLGSTDPTAARDQRNAYAIDIPLTVQGKPWESVRILYWLDDRSLLCRNTDGEYRVVTIDPQSLPLDTTEDVELASREAGPLAIPKTDRRIHWTAPTPDRRSLLFTASRGDESPRLYRVELEGTSEPTELGPVPPGLEGDDVVWIPEPA